MSIERRAEIKLLADLVKHPGRIFDVAAVLKDSDFQHMGTRCIFTGIKRLAESDASLDRERSVDKNILEQRISTLFPDIYKKQEELFSELITEVYVAEGLKMRDFKGAVDFILKNSIVKQAAQVLQKTKDELGDHESYSEVLSHVESSIFDFTANAINGTDIVILGEDYEEFLSIREKLANEGKLHIGISTGFPEFDKAIGGGFRDGTVNMVAARSKFGKSWFAVKIGDNVAKQGIPVLYLDTELENNYQTDRRCAQHTGVPINTLETALWGKLHGAPKKIEEFLVYQKQHPIYYVDIKGWSIDRQISVIRKFFAKYVGKKINGTYNRGLVILDYLKLMRAGEKGSDKEWETLGYRMTLLHDLMGQYNNPMLAFAQQNRDGLERDDESTVSGSDRIIWLCDNFTVMSAIPEAELLIQQDDVDAAALGGKITIPNTRLKIVVCRHGPGTPSGYIAYYFDIKDRRLSHNEVCGKIEEGTRRINIVTGSKAGAI